MEVKSTNFWWLKNKSAVNEVDSGKPVYAAGEYNVSTNSLVDLFEKEVESLREKGETNGSDVDVGSIIEEINRVAAQSPLGPYNTEIGERSVDELMKEAERIYMESSKSFEQLSQRSKTSQNISEISLSSKDSTPTPKSLSPLPLDPQINIVERGSNDNDDSEFYSEDFSEESKLASAESTPSVENQIVVSTEIHVHQGVDVKSSVSEKTVSPEIILSQRKTQNILQSDYISSKKLVHSRSETRFSTDRDEKIEEQLEFERKRREIEMKQMSLKNDLIKALEEDNEKLKKDIEVMK
ncbi:hypothetical protein HHI36_015323, partial [Cryptolaemus montrouzieri]